MATVSTIDAVEPVVFDKAEVRSCKCGQLNFNKITAKPGWKWSECIKPVAKTEV